MKPLIYFFSSSFCGLLVAMSFFGSMPANSAILIEENGKTISTSKEDARETKQGQFFRSHRKVGIGLTGAGALALAGVQIELNFSSHDGILAGVGTGGSFQALKLQYRHYLSGRWFLPYIGGGFARWSAFGKEAVVESTPSFFAEEFLSQEERTTGKFAENLIYPSAGLQYLQLTGPWAGTSLGVEILFLIDMDDFVSAATGEVSLSYYF